MKPQIDYTLAKHIAYLFQEPAKTTVEFLYAVKRHASPCPGTPGKRTPAVWDEVIYRQSDEEKSEKP
jgi:hypothetical protein